VTLSDGFVQKRKRWNTESSEVYLIAGLGNPGLRYKNTRHNIGFRVIGLLASKLGIRLSSKRFHSKNGRVRFAGKEVILLCPQTYMNESGRSIKACVDFFCLDTEKLLVLHDDIDLPLGRIRIARDGGSGGHRGIISIIEHLGTREFARVRIGIGRPRYGEAIEAFVLSPFYENEKSVVEKVVELSAQACEAFVREGLQSAMNHFNCQNLADEEVTN